MITKEENERLAQVGPGTPGGELLRRYWYPVGTLDDLTAESPTRFVRLLGEDLVLFKVTVPTGALPFCTAGLRSEESPAPITAGCTTQRATVSSVPPSRRGACST
jgi:hypothetical protein